MTISLYVKDTNSYLGTLTEEELKLLVDELEEEHMDDQDYFIDPLTLEVMEEKGASHSLIAMLRSAIGESDGVEVRWERK